MKKSTKLKKSLALLYRYTVAVAVVWILIIAGSLIWNINNVQRSIQDMAQKEALSSFQKDKIFRRWIASRGGVYVPLDEKTPSNPYLKHSERDITTTSGKNFTLLNAAHVFSKLTEEYGHLVDVKSRLVSLKPVNPVNEPDGWERKTLIAFEKDTKEIFGFSDINGEPHLRLLSPMVVEDFCLKCHAYQGYKVGEIRGAVGVSLPMATYLSTAHNGIIVHAWTHGIIMLTGLLAIGFVARNFQKSIPETIRAEEKLAKTNEQMKKEIDERKQTEAALRLYEKTIENMAEGVYLIRTSDGVIVYTNPQFERIFGYDSGELNGKHVSIVNAPTEKTPEETAKEIIQSLNENGTWSGEVLNIKKDGNPFWCHANVSTFDHHEFGEVWISVHEDITDRKQTEEDLFKAKNAAEVANKAKSDFLASMSHELRTPLNAIIGFSEVLRDKYFGELNEKQAEYIQDILGSGKHLLSLINDVLDLSKIEAGKMELEVSPVNIKVLLEDSLVMIKEKAYEHGIGLDLKIPEELSKLEIQADKRKLKQIMFNLLSNAAKFTPNDGKIEVIAMQEGEDLLIRVLDTGIGIAPENQEKIFAEFFQVEGGIKDKTHGTGLGLSLTKSLVEIHGGRIWVESEGEGKGSTFSFVIPVT